MQLLTNVACNNQLFYALTLSMFERKTSEWLFLISIRDADTFITSI